MLDKIIEIIMTVLPFLGSSRKKRKVMAQEVKEFSELVKLWTLWCATSSPESVFLPRIV